MFYKESFGNSKLRSQHQRTVYRCILNNHPISRTDITRYTQISKPTVTRIIEEFLGAGLITTSGHSDTVLGRKPELLKIRDDAIAAIGLYFSKTRATISLINVKTSVVFKRQVSIKHVDNSNDFYLLVDELLTGAINVAKERKMIVLGVGVAAPGDVNHYSGTIESLFGGKETIEISDYIKERYCFDTYVDNNANVSALAEWYCGLAKDNQSLVYFIASSGIGVGIINHNALLHGINNRAGEIGKSLVVSNNRAVEAESIASIPAIVKDYSQITGKTISEEDLPKLYANRDKDLKALLINSTKVLHFLAYNLLCTVDTNTVIFSGKYFDYFPEEFVSLQKLIKDKLHEKSMNNVTIHLRKQDETINIIGPGILVFDNAIY